MTNAKKFVVVKLKTKFDEIKETDVIPSTGKYYNSIIFVEETKEIWTHGTKYGLGSDQAQDLEDALHYNTTLGELTTPNAVGGIAAGTKASDLNGKSVDQMLNMLLFPEINPTITAPSASTSFASGFSANGIYEVGATFPTTSNMTYTLNRGSITVPGLDAKNRAGAATGATYAVSGTATSFVSKFSEGTYTIKATVSYGQGDTALTSYSNVADKNANGQTITNPLPAGSIQASGVTVYGVYPMYASSATAGTLTKQTLSNSKTNQQFTLKAGSSQTFAVKGTCSSILEFNSVSGKYDIDKKSGYTTQTITKQDASGADVSYTQYTRTDASGDDVKIQITFN